MSNILQQICILPTLDGQALRERYCRLFGVQAVPNSNKTWLVRQIAYRLQELAHKRSLTDKAMAQVQELLKDNGFDPDTGKPARGLRAQDGRKIQAVAGTVIDREFQGRVYRVTALPRGKWDFEGRAFSSLSAIAREICGVSRSGPQFFGLATESHTGSRRRK